MENELELDLDTELDQVQTNAENKLKVKNRFEKLSEKVILTAKEKEEAEAKVKLEAEARLKAEKERDFYKGFSEISSKYPQATQHQDKILERVNKGYSPKAAALEVLEEVGQLTPITAGTQPLKPENPAGGSAATTITDSGKDVSHMTREEKRNALLEMEKQGVNLLRRE